MVSIFVKWLIAVLTATVVLPLLVIACSAAMSASIPPEMTLVTGACLALFGALLYLTLRRHEPKLLAFLQPLSNAQAEMIAAIPQRSLWIAVFLAAGLSLYLELSIIRWQASVFEFFSFYKNFGLLACFAGLGTGYVLSSRREVPLVCSVPLLVLQQFTLLGLRYFPIGDCAKSLQSLPVAEQLNMGMTTQATLAGGIALYYTLTVMICLTMVALVPIGQLCGQIMSRMAPVPSYGANLLGSLFGIVLMTLSSVLCTPPAAWFAVVYVAIGLFCLRDKRSAAVVLIAALAGMITLSWDFCFGWERVFSPYQLLERGPGDYGWSRLRAAGLYYQRVMDLSGHSRQAHPNLELYGRYYDLPYTYHSPPDSVVVFGAGMGNDVAAGLRNGAKLIHAVEIDPCIAEWGKMYHPEMPYQDPRVRLIVADARAFLRQTTDKFDMIVFGLLDSHALSGQSSSLRIDSYVYTVESLKEARSCLKDGGVLCLSFAAPHASLVHKLHRMLSVAFDGHPPVVLSTIDYDQSFSFFQNKEGTLVARPVTDKRFIDMTQTLVNIKDQPDSSTDDWPFFYMPKRCWPISYLPMLAILVGMTFALNRTLGGRTSPGTAAKNWQFFLLGAGFMLIEAKAITELGLIFGNTWQITGTVIAAVLVLGFIGNLLVQYKRISNIILAYCLALLIIAIGWWTSAHAGFSFSIDGKLATVAVLVGPVVFSGIAFSLLIDSEKDVAAAMCWNLMGAMFGGILEYCAMYTGYRALYILAVVIYGAALACNLLMKEKRADAASPGPVTTGET